MRANYYTVDFKEWFGDSTMAIDGINNIISKYYYGFKQPFVVDTNQATGEGIDATYNARLSIISCSDEVKQKYYEPLFSLGNFKQEHGIVVSRIQKEIDCYKNGNNLVVFEQGSASTPYYSKLGKIMAFQYMKASVYNYLFDKMI